MSYVCEKVKPEQNKREDTSFCKKRMKSERNNELTKVIQQSYQYIPDLTSSNI